MCTSASDLNMFILEPTIFSNNFILNYSQWSICIYNWLKNKKNRFERKFIRILPQLYIIFLIIPVKTIIYFKYALKTFKLVEQFYVKLNWKYSKKNLDVSIRYISFVIFFVFNTNLIYIHMEYLKLKIQK